MTQERSPHPTFAQLADYLDGRLQPEERQRVEAHLATGCPACRSDFAWLERTLATMKDRRWSAPSEPVRQRARTLFSKPPSWVRERARALYNERRIVNAGEGPARPTPRRSWLPAIPQYNPRWAAIAVGVVLIIASLILMQTQQPAVAHAATLEEVGGDVRIRPTPNDAWSPAKKGLRLYAGANIRTGDDGWTVIRFQGNYSVSLRPGADLTIQTIRGRGDQLLDLEFEQNRGEAEYVVPAINTPGFYYKVTTRAGQVIAMQPTRCTVRVEDDGTTWISVAEGSVMVTAGDQSQLLSAGQSLTVTPSDGQDTATATSELPSLTPTITPTPSQPATAPPPTATPSPLPTPTRVPTRPAPTPQPPTWTPQPTEPGEPRPTETPRPSRTPEPPEPTETEEPDPTPHPTETEEPSRTPRPTETEEPDPTSDPTHTEEPEPTETEDALNK